jgi:hypothetical protein
MYNTPVTPGIHLLQTGIIAPQSAFWTADTEADA